MICDHTRNVFASLALVNFLSDHYTRCATKLRLADFQFLLTIFTRVIRREAALVRRWSIMEKDGASAHTVAIGIAHKIVDMQNLKV